MNELAKLHTQVQQGDAVAFTALSGLLVERIGPLLECHPHRGYLDAGDLLSAARAQFTQRQKPPDNLDFFLSGVFEEELRRVLFQRGATGDEEAAALFYRRLHPLLDPLL